MKKHALMVFLGLLTVEMAVGNSSPYINHVYEYVPAPGQFINILPTYEDGDTEADLIAKCEAQIVGRVGSTNYICLGAWGGYVTFGFDHPLVNVPGEYDLRVHGNAFVNAPDTEGHQYGSCEPGIVYVSQDTNGNGLPDDTWYELAGSESARTIRDYEVTYFSDEMDVPWQDNRGNADFIYRNPYHLQQSYYPLWRTDEEYTFRGSLLPSNINPDNQQSYPFAYGYVDVWPNNDERSALKLDWAIDAEGNPANLTHVDFVRVQTGTMVTHWGNGGLNGEMSTEVCGAEDLHPDAQLPEGISNIGETMHGEPQKFLINGQVFIRRGEHLYNAAGQIVR